MDRSIDNQLACRQLEQVCKQGARISLSSIPLSAALVAGLWPMVASQTLLTWLLLLWLVTAVRCWHMRQCVWHGCDDNTYVRWRNGLALGSMAAGFCWVGVMFFTLVSSSDHVLVLLMMALAGVTAIGSVSLAGVPVAAGAFTLSILLPLAVWLFLPGDSFHAAMGGLTLIYMMVVQLLSLQAREQMRKLLEVTEKNKALLTELQSVDERMKAYFRKAPGFFFTVHRDGTGRYAVSFASERVMDVYGLSPDAVRLDFSAWAARTHPDDRAMIRHEADVSARNLSHCRVEHRVQHPTKGERWVEVNVMPQREADGGTRWDGFVHDITERKRMDASLAAREHEFRTLTENLPVAVVRYDADCRRRYLNRTAERMLRGSASDLVGQVPGGPTVLATPHMIEHYRSQLAAVLADGVMREVEFVLDELPAEQREYFEVRFARESAADNGRPSALAIWFDITARRRTQQQLDLLQRAVDMSADAIFVHGEQVRFIYVNGAASRQLGYSREELLAMGPPDLNPNVSHEDMVEILHRPLDSPVVIVETSHRKKDGSVFPVELGVSRFEMGGAKFGVAVVRDITERKRMEDALLTREQESRTLLEHSPDTIARYDGDCRRVYVNPAFAAMVEGGATALLGKTPCECPGGEQSAAYEEKLSDVLASGQNSEFELQWTGLDGELTCSHIRIAAEHDASGAVVSALAVGRDITDLHKTRQQIQHLAFHDVLTELPNRALFNDRLRKMLGEAAWRGQSAAVMVLDLDRFKNINDTLGHTAGDALLCEAAGRLTSCMRVYDTVARLGGDEFAVLLPDVRSPADLGGVATKISDVFAAPFLLEGKEVFVTASLGISVYPDDGDLGDDLLRNADAAMYQAKRLGRNGFCFYSKELTSCANERLALESDLRHALSRNELVLYFQPKIDLRSGVLQGSEALLRWVHPSRGLVPPDQFISIAEDSGLIVEIGVWVVRSACQTARAWNGDGRPLHKLAINLSARQFQSGDLVGTVRQALAETACLAQWIELEITESLLIDEDGTVLETLNTFRSMGITIAIDDFGTGYSALSYLARFPIDTLKIDRSFIAHVSEQGHHAELVKAIISISHCLGQKVVAEGVESTEQALFLQTHGCHLAQGYFYSKPVPREVFEQLPVFKV